MCVQLPHAAASLTSPAIALKYKPTGVRRKPNHGSVAPEVKKGFLQFPGVGRGQFVDQHGVELLSAPPRDPAAPAQKWPTHRQNHGGNLQRGRRAPLRNGEVTKARLAVSFKIGDSGEIACLKHSRSDLPGKGRPGFRLRTEFDSPASTARTGY